MVNLQKKDLELLLMPKQLCLKDIRYFYENNTTLNNQFKWNLHLRKDIWEYLDKKNS